MSKRGAFTDNLSKKCRTFVLSCKNMSVWVTKCCDAIVIVTVGLVFVHLLFVILGNAKDLV